MERRSTGRSATYGQACLACFKTKCKCIPRSDGDGCERCHRLMRPCQKTDISRRRGDKMPTSSDARIARLEGTLGQLVNMLSTNSPDSGEIPNNPPQEQHASPLPIPFNVEQSAKEITGGSTRMVGNNDQVNLDNDVMDPSLWAGQSENFFNGTSSIPLATPPPSSLPWAAVTRPPTPPSTFTSNYLDAFRRDKLYLCPFVRLNADITSQQLQRDRPFLCRAIVCVMSSSIAERRTGAHELKRELSEATMAHQSSQDPQALRRKLDLLLGLLVYIAWGWDHIHSGGSLSRLMMTAMSLAGDMCLDRIIPAPTISLFDPQCFVDWQGGTSTELNDAQFLLERQRAVLGCFVLASSVSAYFQQIDPPRWLPYMEECLTALKISGTKEGCLSDGTLWFLGCIQLLAIKAVQACERCQPPDDDSAATLPEPALTELKTLMIQVQELRANIPAAVQQTVFALTHIYHTELCIMETAHLWEMANAPPKSGTARLWYFWQSALAIKSCTSTFLTLTPSEFAGISFLQWAQLARCIASLHSLWALSDLGYDMTAVRRLVDLPALLVSTAEKLELTSAEAAEDPVDGVFAQLARGMRGFQLSYSEGKGAQQGDAQTGVGTDVDVIMQAQQEEFLSNPTIWFNLP